MFSRLLSCALCVCFISQGAQQPGSGPPLPAVTFYDHVLPVLQKHCQSCHRPGEIGPMPLVSYKDVRPWAAAIREAVTLRRMPPWFADPKHGAFANDPRLSDDEIKLINLWAESGAPEGRSPADGGRAVEVTRAPMSADFIVTVPVPIHIPANAVIDYQYVVLPLPFTSDRWVRSVEIRPSDRSVVHHAVLYVREPRSPWLRNVSPGVFYAPSRNDPAALARTRDTKEEILAIYTPGAAAMTCPAGMAKRIPAGSDLVLQLHYTSRKTATVDQPQVGLAFTDQPPKRILTLQMGRDDLRIPPGEAGYSRSVSGTLPADALLISMFPHMHLRGAAFDFDIIGPNGYVETLLRVKPYNFYWQLNYILKTPRMLLKGTRLRWTGYFDNSANNPNNPDPAAEVTWGEQSWDEMMIGFFDVAVDTAIDKQRYFTSRAE
jgi:hypothetical protein